MIINIEKIEISIPTSAVSIFIAIGGCGFILWIFRDDIKWFFTKLYLRLYWKLIHLIRKIRNGDYDYVWTDKEE